MIQLSKLDKLSDEEIDELMINAMLSARVHLANALNEEGKIKDTHIRNALSDLRDYDVMAEYEKPGIIERVLGRIFK